MKMWPLLFIPVLALSSLSVWNEANTKPPTTSYPGVLAPTHTSGPVPAPETAVLPSPAPGPPPSTPAARPE
jgi:hypothetical protein